MNKTNPNTAHMTAKMREHLNSSFARIYGAEMGSVPTRKLIGGNNVPKFKGVPNG